MCTAAAANNKGALLALCDGAPKNGVGASEELQAAIEAAIDTLAADTTTKPARQPLNGVYDLLYCTSAGGSSGKVGPLVGDVTQSFLDGTTFVNAVSFFGGALEIALRAERAIVDDKRIKVTFCETTVRLFGRALLCRPTQGAGVWVQRYVDDGLRVMNTPSVFVLRKNAEKSALLELKRGATA
eukprot:CAMPEP_0183342246 /NCGR_PEP_ID=MMETSP0164_2-20130417/8391_1 /TAXON_ID=221442 /ORGANISM="Coccolithus pelagicus ssp braarudi, Strain PLY182g" /LENGTH=183 /DNA_ID=CAMNT_0025512775 /DNA_START=144 /DNA_END=695 /DNA_ORIENTATION=-